MGSIAHIDNHWNATVEPRILDQYSESVRWQDCLRASIADMQLTEDAAMELATVLDYETERPSGGKLDWIAGLVNIKRMAGEGDANLFERFVASLGNKSAGTPDNIIYNTAILAGDPKPQYMDEVDCTFFEYTGPKPNHEPVPEDEVFDYERGDTSCDEGADQLYARQVQKLAPCGVLGLVGAAIQFADGSLMGDAQGRLFLAVADDSTVERTLVLADDNALPIVTPQSVPVQAVVKGSTVPTIPVTLGGHQYDAVRIKDLPDAGAGENGFMVRDSESGGTVRADAIDAQGVDELWDATEPEQDEE